MAHLDHDASNNSEHNLAFLCFDHHDEYDSKTSQRKGLTLDEVKQFRAELIVAIDSTFSQTVHFGRVQIPPSDPYAGQWVRLGTESDSAEILVTPLPDDSEGFARYFVSGLALWGINRDAGPNLGFLDFVAIVDEHGVMSHARRVADRVASTRLQFTREGLLEVREADWFGVYGMNVNFNGSYMRAGLRS